MCAKDVMMGFGPTDIALFAASPNNRRKFRGRSLVRRRTPALAPMMPEMCTAKVHDEEVRGAARFVGRASGTIPNLIPIQYVTARTLRKAPIRAEPFTLGMSGRFPVPIIQCGKSIPSFLQASTVPPPYVPHLSSLVVAASYLSSASLQASFLVS